MAGNLWKAWNKSVRLSRMLLREGADPQISGRFYVAVMQYVLLFRSETWLVMPHILRYMGSLHNVLHYIYLEVCLSCFVTEDGTTPQLGKR